jgi:hypothetical protein
MFNQLLTNNLNHKMQIKNKVLFYLTRIDLSEQLNSMFISQLLIKLNEMLSHHLNKSFSSLFHMNIILQYIDFHIHRILI